MPINYLEFVQEHVLSCEVGHRGGNLRVDASELFPTLGDNAIVGAYQNYLGGGIAGRIVGAAMFHPTDVPLQDRVHFHPLLEACQRHFFNVNNGGGDDYMQDNHNTYEFNQSLPESGY